MSKLRPCLIGRHSGCDITLKENSVSRHHAEALFLCDGRVYVTGCDSKAGTFVYRSNNWEAITQDFIDHKEWLRLGNYSVLAGQLASMQTPGLQTPGMQSHTATLPPPQDDDI